MEYVTLYIKFIAVKIHNKIAIIKCIAIVLLFLGFLFLLLSSESAGPQCKMESEADFTP